MTKRILIVLLFASLAAAQVTTDSTVSPVTTPPPPPPTPKCGKNEAWNCRWGCDADCAKIGQPCNSLGFMCTEKCYCIKGYARDYKGICIPIERCPYRTVCPKNEVYDNMIPSCPWQRDCYFLLNGDDMCDEPITYYASCRCKDGYVREDYVRQRGILTQRSKCIPRNKCCQEPNTTLFKDQKTCLGNTCQQPIPSDCTDPVKPWACQCRKGFVKVSDKNSTCINLADC